VGTLVVTPLLEMLMYLADAPDDFQMKYPIAENIKSAKPITIAYL
jgi:hypothetical protein